jgi:hypothetical protein
MLIFCLESCVLHDSILQWIRQRKSIELCANHGKSAMEALATKRQAFGAENLSRTRKSVLPEFDHYLAIYIL